MPDLVARWREIHNQLVGLTAAARITAASAILQAENPMLSIDASEMPLYTIEGRQGAMGNVKFSLDAIRWELGPGGAGWPEWDTASELQVSAQAQELGIKLWKVE